MTERKIDPVQFHCGNLGRTVIIHRHLLRTPDGSGWGLNRAECQEVCEECGVMVRTATGYNYAWEKCPHPEAGKRP